MATLFPTAQDDSSTLPNPSASSPTNNPSLASGQSNQNDAIKAIEAKVGVSASTPTLNKLLVGTGTGSSAWTKDSPTGSIVGTTDSQTLTNKTINGGTISNATISNPTLTVDSVVGFTATNNGSIYGIPVTSSTVNGSILQSGTVGSTALATNAVQASQIATNAITLGYAQITTTFSTGATSATQVTGVTTTVTIPSGGRRIRVSGYCFNVNNSGSARNVDVSIWDGAVGSGTLVGQATNYITTGGFGNALYVSSILTVAAGSKTYNMGVACSAGGTTNMNAASTLPIYILVEAI